MNTLCATDGVSSVSSYEFSKKGLGHLYSVLGDIEEMGVGEAPKVIAHIPNLMDNRRKQEQEELESIGGELVEDLGEEHACVVDPFFNRAQLVRSGGDESLFLIINQKNS